MVDFKVTNHLGLPAFGPTGGLNHILTWDPEYRDKRKGVRVRRQTHRQIMKHNVR